VSVKEGEKKINSHSFGARQKACGWGVKKARSQGGHGSFLQVKKASQRWKEGGGGKDVNGASQGGG